MRLNSNLKIMGICAGQGVLLYPFRKHLVGNIEPRSLFHTPCNTQWIANFPDCPIYKKPILHNSNPHVIISTPDCGSGSIFRLSRAKVLGDHKQNQSLSLFIQSIQLYQPLFFLFENLNGLFKSYPQEQFLSNFPGYRFIVYDNPVSVFGNSQIHRKRLVIIGIKNTLPDKVDKYFKLPKPKKLKTCFELYGELTKENIAIGHSREQSSLLISVYAKNKMQIAKITLEWTQRLKGKKRWHIEGKSNFSTAPGVYRNLANDYPATARKANRQFDHNGEMLTPRQLARVMGIPDKFHIPIESRRLLYWINKGRTSVTKGAVYEIGIWFKKSLKKSQHIWQNWL